MLTAAIASADATSSAQLLASVQQVGLMSSVQQWAVHADKLLEVTGIIPDVVILDLARNRRVRSPWLRKFASCNQPSM